MLPLRVALVTNAPKMSGMGKPSRLLLDALRKVGGADLHLDDYVLDAGESVVSKNGVVIAYRRPYSRLKPVAWVRLAAALRPHLADYDLVHLTNQTLAFLARRLRCPTVLTVWDIIELLDPQEWGGALAARYLYSGIPFADRVIAVSHYTARTVRETYCVPEMRITIIPPAASLTFRAVPHIWQTVGGKEFLFRNRVPASVLRTRVGGNAHARDAPLIVYVGSAHRRKNLRCLLEAVGRVRAAFPGLLFVKIGGEGSTAGHADFVSAVQELRLGPIIRIVPECDDDELLYWYHAATVLAFPSLFEGFGLPPLEAMSCGTPVVTSDRTSIPEVVGDAALRVNPESSESIAEGLKRVLSDPALRSSLRERGLARAATFTWKRTAAETLGAYRSALQHARSSTY